MGVKWIQIEKAGDVLGDKRVGDKDVAREKEKMKITKCFFKNSFKDKIHFK